MVGVLTFRKVGLIRGIFFFVDEAEVVPNPRDCCPAITPRIALVLVGHHETDGIFLAKGPKSWIHWSQTAEGQMRAAVGISAYEHVILLPTDLPAKARTGKLARHIKLLNFEVIMLVRRRSRAPLA